MSSYASHNFAAFCCFILICAFGILFFWNIGAFDTEIENYDFHAIVLSITPYRTGYRITFSNDVENGYVFISSLKKLPSNSFIHIYAQIMERPFAFTYTRYTLIA